MKRANLVLFVALGVVFWFVAALIIRFCGTSVFTENNPYLIGLYALTIPLTVGFLFVAKTVGKLDYADLVEPTVVMTFTAAFLDAVALTWFRALYGESFEVALHGAALILWGVGLALLFAFVLDRRAGRPL